MTQLCFREDVVGAVARMSGKGMKGAFGRKNPQSREKRILSCAPYSALFFSSMLIVTVMLNLTCSVRC